MSADDVLRNLLDACDRGRPLTDIAERLRVEVARLGTAPQQPDREQVREGRAVMRGWNIYDEATGVLLDGPEAELREAAAATVATWDAHIVSLMACGCEEQAKASADLARTMLAREEAIESLRALLACSRPPAQADPSERDHGVRLMHGPNCEFCKGVARALIGREARKADRASSLSVPQQDEASPVSTQSTTSADGRGDVPVAVERGGDDVPALQLLGVDLDPVGDQVGLGDDLAKRSYTSLCNPMTREVPQQGEVLWEGDLGELMYALHGPIQSALIDAFPDDETEPWQVRIQRVVTVPEGAQSDGE